VSNLRAAHQKWQVFRTAGRLLDREGKCSAPYLGISGSVKGGGQRRNASRGSDRQTSVLVTKFHAGKRVLIPKIDEDAGISAKRPGIQCDALRHNGHPQSKREHGLITGNRIEKIARVPGKFSHKNRPSNRWSELKSAPTPAIHLYRLTAWHLRPRGACWAGAHRNILIQQVTKQEIKTAFQLLTLFYHCVECESFLNRDGCSYAVTQIRRAPAS